MATYKKYHPVSAMEYPRYSGIRTFMRLPHITDLSADVDIAIVGVPFDTGGTYRVGARFGPGGIRDQSMLLRPYNPVLLGQRKQLANESFLPPSPCELLKVIAYE